MKLIKDGIAKTIPAERVPEYLAAGWVSVEPEKQEKPKTNRSKKGA